MSDSLWTAIFSCLGTIAFVILIGVAMVNIGDELLKFVAKLPFLKNIFEVSFGISVSGEVSLNILFAVCFTHLVTLMLAWATIVATVTRTSVGEVERGTADLLFSLPLTRWRILVSVTVVWVLIAAVIALCPLIGVFIGSRIYARQETIEFARFGLVTANLFALHLAIGGIATLVSSLTLRRGQAIAIIMAIALVSVALNFVEPFIKAVERIRFLGLLYYFRPADIVRTGEFSGVKVGVLLALAFVTWLIGTIVFCRKDIPVA